MIKNLKSLILAVATLGLCLSASAQDLSSQRGESQYLGGLFGSKLDHQGVVINPTPQELTRYNADVISIANGVALNDKATQFTSELDFVTHNKKGAKLSIDFGEKVAAKCGVEPRKGAYNLTIDKNGITIRAYDELGAFYGVQTLREIVASPASDGGLLDGIVIRDWADLEYRGVVEGFYGEPWSHATRLSLIDIYGRYKMNYYIYGPKDDPYHSSPHWRLPYPDEKANEIAELVDACRRNRVNFVWAIHPGQDIKWCEEDLQNLINKFEAMYALGVRAFAIHFDDIEGEGTNPYRQTELMNILNEEFVAVKGDVASLIVCPTDYTRLWANPSERGSLVIYGKELHPSIDVFWTGDAVCSDMTESTMEWISSRIQRPVLFWWNFPVTDYARHILMQGPVYGLSPAITAEKSRGLVSNPMEHGEASKLALYSVADYTWNTEAYNPIDSWERGLEMLAPEVKDAYRLFAIHSCDTETGYRRIESWETETFTLDEYSEDKAAALREELERIVAVPEIMKSMENKALYAELQPWLVEFGKLGERCLGALDCIELYRKGDYPAFWECYAEHLMSDAEIEAYDAHRVGTMKLHPFYERIMDSLAAAYYEQLTGEKSSTLSAAGTYKSLQSPQAKYMFDNDPETYYHSGQGQRTDDFVAADMGIVRTVRELRILQGRNSTDDVDYFDHVIVEYSADGEEWIALTEPLQGVYDIEWAGEPFEARYVGIRKLESQKRNWLAVRSFDINPVTKEQYGEDCNPFTALRPEGGVHIDLDNVTRLVVLMEGIDANSVIRLFDANGKELECRTLASAYLCLEDAASMGAKSATIEGVGQIFEIIRF